MFSSLRAPLCRHLFVAVHAFSLPLFLPILLHFIQAFPLTCLHSHLLSQGLSEIKNAGYFHFSAAPQQKSSGQQSASRCLPYYNSAPGCSAPLYLNYSSLSSGISSSKASIQLSLCHLSFSPFSLAATFCRCAWSFIMVPIGFSARSSIMW